MKVDFTVTNVQPLSPPTDFGFPSEVDIRVGLYDEQANFPDTVYAGQVTTLNFQHDGTQTQTVTFDVDPATVSNERVYWGYEISAPATIAGEDFDEGDLFLTVEEGVAFLYLYPIKFDDLSEMEFLQNDNTYTNYTAPTPSTDFVPQYPTDTANQCTIVPDGFENFPVVYASFLNCAPTGTPNNMDTPITPIPGEPGENLAGNQITTYVSGGVFVPLVLAENTNEFYNIVSAYPNLRFQAKVTPTPLSGGIDPNDGGVVLGDAFKILIDGVRFPNKDFLEIDFQIRRPTVNGETLATINSFSEVGTTVQAWFPAFLEFEVEVQNPTSGEWSIYTPRINFEPILMAFRIEVGFQETSFGGTQIINPFPSS